MFNTERTWFVNPVDTCQCRSTDCRRFLKQSPCPDSAPKKFINRISFIGNSVYRICEFTNVLPWRHPWCIRKVGEQVLLCSVPKIIWDPFTQGAPLAKNLLRVIFLCIRHGQCPRIGLAVVSGGTVNNCGRAIMTARIQPLAWQPAFTRAEKFHFDRLKRRIVDQLQARGCHTLALCGSVEEWGCRFVELFGCVVIPADEFLAYEDEEISALVRFQLRVLRDEKANPEIATAIA